MSYDELVRHLILTETQYKDDLELLIKLFRNPLRTLLNDQDDGKLIDDVFSCLDDIHELTCRFLSDLEDAKEMRDEQTQVISITEPFQNFLDGNEYECYINYTRSILDKNHSEHFQKLLQNERVLIYLQVIMNCDDERFRNFTSTSYFCFSDTK